MASTRDPVCVVGLGRVGLPTAVLWAEAGHAVAGVERDPARREAVSAARVGADEPDLAAALRRQLEAGRLTVHARPVDCGVAVVCVPTPLGAGHAPDLTDLWAAVRAVGEVVRPDGLVLVDSTVPVGTTEAVARALRATLPQLAVAHCPERVLPGRALHEMRHNPRLVGGVDPASTAVAAAAMGSVVAAPVRRTDARTAELAKLAENTARDVHLALANELATLASHHGVDPWRLRALVNEHPRVTLLRPGPGVGGPCIPVDPWFLAQGGLTPLIAAARLVNDGRPDRVVSAVLASLPQPDVEVGVLGLTYKPDVADLTGSPALAVARGLGRATSVLVHDPWVEPPSDLRAGTLEQVLACDVVVVLVAHRAYHGLRPELAHRAVFDVVGLLAPDDPLG